MSLSKTMLKWAVDTFGNIALERRERTLRFIEEAIELSQSLGLSADEVARVTQRVYEREPGDMKKEMGQAGTTLMLLAESELIDLEGEIKHECNRVRRIPATEWDRRHQAKVELGIAAPMDHTRAANKV